MINNDFPCIDCLKFPICRSLFMLEIKVTTPDITYEFQKYNTFMNCANKLYEFQKYDTFMKCVNKLIEDCNDLYEFLIDVKIHPSINKCRVDMVRDYYLNY